MVQTSAGAKNNDWLTFMRACALTYRKQKEGSKPKAASAKKRTASKVAHSTDGKGATRKTVKRPKQPQSLREPKQSQHGRTLMHAQLASPQTTQTTGVANAGGEVGKVKTSSAVTQEVQQVQASAGRARKRVVGKQPPPRLQKEHAGAAKARKRIVGKQPRPEL